LIVYVEPENVTNAGIVYEKVIGSEFTSVYAGSV